jgi:hypothetical protein
MSRQLNQFVDDSTTLDVRRTKINKIKIEKCYTIFTGASKNRLYHLFQLADEDLEGFKAPCSGNVGGQ